MLHYFSLLVAVSTAVLIFAGGLVTSTGSGLSVPDWPNTYGWFMFTFPLEKMVGGIFYEHSHRLIASTVGFLILVLAFWLGRTEPRGWVRRLGYFALAAVIVQGLLGGITVLWYLPEPISISHASLAQLVFCATTAIAVFTSPGWKRGYSQMAPHEGAPYDGRDLSHDRGVSHNRDVGRAFTVRRRGDVGRDFAVRRHGDVGRAFTPRRRGDVGRAFTARRRGDVRLQQIAVLATATVYVQIVVGATMRHLGAGLAIPDFPFAFGQIVPPHWDTGIAIHFAHRVGALIVTALILATTAHVFYHHRRRTELVRPSIALIVLLTAQITLGALTVLSGRHHIINSLHVVTGGLVLVTSLVLTLRAWRPWFADAPSGSARDTGLGSRPLADRAAGARA